jgi:hypothetical protein
MPQRTILAVAILTGIVLASPGRVAFADEDPSSKAEVLFKEGLALVEQATPDGDPHKLEEATRKFLAAYGLDPRPNALFNAALTEQKLNRPADAIHHFRQILRNPACDSKLTAQVGKHITELAAKVATIQLEAPAGAEIVIDGASVGEKAPLADPIDLMPGKHAIQARMNGSTSIEVDAIAGTSRVLRIEKAMGPAQPSLVPAPTSSATPQPAASTAPTEPPAAMDARGPESRPTFWTTRRKWGVGVAGVGVASLVVSGVFQAQSGSDKDRANSIRTGLGSSDCFGTSPRPACGSLRDAYAAQDRDLALSRVFLGVGVVGVAAGAAMFLWPNSSSTVHTAIAPFAVPHGGGLELHGDL